MRGLDATEWDLLVDALGGGCPCDEQWVGSPFSEAEERAQERLVARRLVVHIPCRVDPEDTHLDTTPAGRLLLALGRRVVVG